MAIARLHTTPISVVFLNASMMLANDNPSVISGFGCPSLLAMKVSSTPNVAIVREIDALSDLGVLQHVYPCVGQCLE